MNDLFTLVDQLKKVEHFKHLSPSDLKTIVLSGHVKGYENGATLFLEGDPCAGMYVLLSGKVDLCKTGPEGQFTILNSIHPVIMFNEVPVLDGGVNPVSAIAHEKTYVWHVSCKRFHTIIAQHPQLAIGLLKVMARRNRMMMSHYDDLSFRSITARIAKHLLDLSDNGKKPIDRLSNPIKNMAACVVTVPEVVSRALKKISSQNIIEVDRKSIRVIDPIALQQLAEIPL
jgi:CRP/FNR family cyclic AMP-dependent transcriptional regulator